MCLDFEERRRTSAEGGEKSFFLCSPSFIFSLQLPEREVLPHIVRRSCSSRSLPSSSCAPPQRQHAPEAPEVIEVVGREGDARGEGVVWFGVLIFFWSRSVFFLSGVSEEQTISRSLLVESKLPLSSPFSLLCSHILTVLRHHVAHPCGVYKVDQLRREDELERDRGGHERVESLKEHGGKKVSAAKPFVQKTHKNGLRCRRRSRPGPPARRGGGRATGTAASSSSYSCRRGSAEPQLRPDARGQGKRTRKRRRPMPRRAPSSPSFSSLSRVR